MWVLESHGWNCPQSKRIHPGVQGVDFDRVPSTDLFASEKELTLGGVSYSELHALCIAIPRLKSWIWKQSLRVRSALRTTFFCEFHHLPSI